jgi:hypothetical protein
VEKGLVATVCTIGIAKHLSPLAAREEIYWMVAASVAGEEFKGNYAKEWAPNS